jgi:hypothetical protein
LTIKTDLAGRPMVDRGSRQGRAAGMLVSDGAGIPSRSKREEKQSNPCSAVKFACSMKTIPCSISQGICS